MTPEQQIVQGDMTMKRMFLILIMTIFVSCCSEQQPLFNVGNKFCIPVKNHLYAPQYFHSQKCDRDYKVAYIGDVLRKENNNFIDAKIYCICEGTYSLLYDIQVENDTIVASWSSHWEGK